MKNAVISVSIALALFGMAGEASAKGCLKGAAAGAVAGHVAGHHAVIGAVGGCIVGHHLANKKAKDAAVQQAPATQPTAMQQTAGKAQ